MWMCHVGNKPGEKGYVFSVLYVYQCVCVRLPFVNKLILNVVLMCVDYRCTFFQWAEFDDDGEPPWVLGFRGGKKMDVEERGEENG